MLSEGAMVSGVASAMPGPVSGQFLSASAGDGPEKSPER